MPTDETERTYHQYLRLEDLLCAQHPVAIPAAHDELLFIVTHQTYELWFKLMLFEVEAIRDAMAAGQGGRALHLFERVHRLQELLVTQLAMLETMTREGFEAFRDALAPASGLQSLQYRELEFLSGSKDAHWISMQVGLSSPGGARLSRRFREPTLWDGYLALLARHGLPVGERELAGTLAGVDADPDGPLRPLMQCLRRYDQLSAAWLSRHLVLVAGLVGSAAPGTGGTSGLAFLEGRLARRHFPLLSGGQEFPVLTGGRESPAPAASGTPAVQ